MYKFLNSILAELYKRAIIGYPPNDKRDEKRAIREAREKIVKLVK